jgi:hypothetical protein
MRPDRPRLAALAVVACALHCGGNSASTAAPPAGDAGRPLEGSAPTTDATSEGYPSPVHDAAGADGAGLDAKEEGVGVLDAGACGTLPGPGQWQNVTPPAAMSDVNPGTSAIAVRPDYPSTIYAGTNGKGIFRSTDCGATWALVSTGAHASDMASGNGWSMAIDPVEPDTMYVVEGYGSSGLWKSTNAGVDWANVLDPTITAAFYANGFITGVNIDPANHLHVVVESHGNCASGALCAAESLDAGSTWKLIDMSSVGGWSENSSIAMVDKTTWLYCGLFSGFFRTSDEGATWLTVDAGGALPSCNYYDPRLWQAADGRYYVPAIAYTGPGLLQSAPNDATSWSLVSGSPQATVLLPTEKHLILSGRSGSFWIASQSDPTTWTALATPAAWMGNDSGIFLAYDGVHHILYSSNWGLGLWQTVTD